MEIKLTKISYTKEVAKKEEITDINNVTNIKNDNKIINKYQNKNLPKNTNNSSKIVLIGGGTAGHVMPNLALIPYLLKEFEEVHYIGSNGMEKTLISSEPKVIYHEITSGKLRRKLTLKNLLIPFLVLKGYFQSKKILREIKPCVIFSKGGYVAVPPAMSAKKLKIPLISHESDLTLGLANKIIYKRSDVMFCSFEKTTEYGAKCKYSGTAIRDNLLYGNKEETVKKYNLEPTKKTILVTGGSSGSRELNNALKESLDELIKEYNVIHLTGKGNKDESINKYSYVQIEFEKDPSGIFAAADYIVSRAGSNTIFEFLALRKPMLLIPLSKNESRGDQILNAAEFEKNGYSLTLLSEDLTKETFLKKIKELSARESELIENMKKSKTSNGTNIILQELLKYKK